MEQLHTPSIHFTTVMQRGLHLDKRQERGDAVRSMSYWTFTDIFEESAPRWTAFHGSFGR
jgi:beta-xylosidase